MRVGIGYDVHKLEEGRSLVLGGVEIPFEKGLVGWSDADVVIHAIIDALLGAAALGDIGTHFPSGDSRYKEVSSVLLLQKTNKLLGDQGWQVGNIDVTIVAHEPKMGPFIEEMRSRIAEALATNSELVSVKAKSGNGIGSIGEGKGIEAYAVALVEAKV
ncbi:MAG: 2-C-methyl-D-erythritol 2,4-cyclodiphosphate synthase [Dehalococcoidia bacterium]|nr:2-C-methyl-D-erythritol 2,4-cyclodiphosphate synthase [Dehalococcoidia bacterium]